MNYGTTGVQHWVLLPENWGSFHLFVTAFRKESNGSQGRVGNSRGFYSGGRDF
jgi:hypothetical protein